MPRKGSGTYKKVGRPSTQRKKAAATSKASREKAKRAKKRK